MAKFWNKRNKNLTSLIFGIILIFAGLTGSAITIPSQKIIIIIPLLSLIIGAILSIMGGLEKW